jgi:hypothetical protein
MPTHAPTRFATMTLLIFLAVPTLWAGPRFEIVVPEGSLALERLAGLELRGYLATLSGEEVRIRPKVSQQAGMAFVIGERQYLDGGTRVSEHGFKLSRLQAGGSSEILFVDGGSPRATLWGAYEWAYRYGVRHALDGDVLPAKPVVSSDGWQQKYEPDFPARVWSLRLDSPLGPGSWSLDEHRRVVRQLAKNRFTGVLLEVRPWQPFVHYAISGVERTTGDLWRRRFPLDSDSAGKAAFRGAREFVSPVFEGRKTYGEKRAAAERLARGIFEEAHRFGVHAGLSFAPFEFPLEYRDVLLGLYAGEPLASVLPGARLESREAVLADAIRARLRAVVETYRDLHTIVLDLTNLPPWGASCEAAWRRLGKRGRLARGIPLGELVIGFERRMVEVSALEFLADILSDSALLEREHGTPVKLVLEGISTAVAARLENCLPAGTLFMTRGSEELPVALAARSVRTLELGGRDEGALPRQSLRTIEKALSQLRQSGAAGYIVRAGLVGDLDLAAHFLGRASFDRRVTSRSAGESFWSPFADESSLERLLRGFEHIEDATALIDEAPVDLESAPPAALPSWLKQASELYNSALVEMHRSRFGIHANAQRVVMYFAKRTEFATGYLAGLESNAAANLVDDVEVKVEKLEAGIESFYDAADALREVIRCNGDRGLIAVLNEYAYRDLVRRSEALQGE